MVARAPASLAQLEAENKSPPELTEHTGGKDSLRSQAWVDPCAGGILSSAKVPLSPPKSDTVPWQEMPVRSSAKPKPQHFAPL